MAAERSAAVVVPRWSSNTSVDEIDVPEEFCTRPMPSSTAGDRSDNLFCIWEEVLAHRLQNEPAAGPLQHLKRARTSDMSNITPSKVFATESMRAKTLTTKLTDTLRRSQKHRDDTKQQVQWFILFSLIMTVICTTAADLNQTIAGLEETVIDQHNQIQERDAKISRMGNKIQDSNVNAEALQKEVEWLQELLQVEQSHISPDIMFSNRNYEELKRDLEQSRLKDKSETDERDSRKCLQEYQTALEAQKQDVQNARRTVMDELMPQFRYALQDTLDKYNADSEKESEPGCNADREELDRLRQEALGKDRHHAHEIQRMYNEIGKMKHYCLAANARIIEVETQLQQASSKKSSTEGGFESTRPSSSKMDSRSNRKLKFDERISTFSAQASQPQNQPHTSYPNMQAPMSSSFGSQPQSMPFGFAQPSGSAFNAFGQPFNFGPAATPYASVLQPPQGRGTSGGPEPVPLNRNPNHGLGDDLLESGDEADVEDAPTSSKGKKAATQRCTEWSSDVDSCTNNTATKRRSKWRKKGTTGEFKARRAEQLHSPESNAIMGKIRDLQHQLLGITKDKDVHMAFAKGKHTSIKIANDYYNGVSEHAQSLDPFYPCWADIKHRWNYELRDLFVDHFIAELEEENKGWISATQYIGDHFMQCLNTMKQSMERHLNGSWDHTATISHRGRRCGFLWESHMKFASERRKKSAYMPLTHMLDLCGPEAMSTDESDGGGEVYNVVRKEWRSMHVIVLLKWLDHKRDADSHTGFGNRKARTTSCRRQRYPHGRAPNSVRKPIAQLPINFYDADWLQTCTAQQWADLDPLPAMELPLYVFTWPEFHHLPVDKDDQDEYQILPG
ncbi:hypothetical protein ARMGADRAFT_1084403 [Armillaria gallica]|uniref:Uncharacterized protein n=1 Tax=Armillaria gallica TaxID=47427 RepID=A0A2H3D0S0_ARMGA|nr:hypothetical protein ARMGADRAFT_1084403 [Armillaria gallica]